MRDGFARSRSTPQRRAKEIRWFLEFGDLSLSVVRCSEPTQILRELSHSSAKSQPERAPGAKPLLIRGNRQIATQVGPDR